jgi:ATP-binding cassette subfamily B protein
VRAHALDFTYPAGHRPALTGVDIEIGAGEIVALVGENGSGKSTLTKLLAGLYPPKAGALSWNGVDYAELDITTVREQIAVLFQDYVRFELTLGDNVQFGRWRHAAPDDSALRRAADAAGAGPVVESMPDGWATRMGPEYGGGRELSGGQWQRLAIARALFRDAPLVILDEPTASLDPRAEAALFRDVRTLFAGRSVVLVSHRFASVRHADRIYVLHDGAVVEVGTHDELVAREGRYAEMFKLQWATLIGDGGGDVA